MLPVGLDAFTVGSDAPRRSVRAACSVCLFPFQLAGGAVCVVLKPELY